MSRRRVAGGYDGLAKIYDLLARMVYGNALRKAQTTFLNDFPKNADVLVVGGGSGWFLEQLMKQSNPKFVLYVELSPKMLALAKLRIQNNCPEAFSRIEFVEGSVEDVVEEGTYDVVVTHCLLDMFAGLQLQAIVRRLRNALHTGGQWYFSDFRHAKNWPMSWISRMMIWMMYRLFKWWCDIPATRLPDFQAAFDLAGLKISDSKHFFGGMIEAKMLKKG
jgi:tRNA (cmo5U34)-methyltransferase